MERYYHDNWSELNGNITRPDGFLVTEEIDYKPATEWKGEKTGKYAVYLLNKKSVDHFSVINELQKILKNKIKYLGIKDANAITSQLIYIEISNKKDNIELIREYNTENFSIKFLGITSQKLNHTGNIFKITINTNNTNEMKERIQEISKDPFLPAFIGYQRFGSRRPITHVVGKFLLKRDWKNAFYSIVSYPFLSESEEMRQFRRLILENRFDEALNRLSVKFKQERILMKNYIKFRNYYLALKNSLIPISLYLDAYQSYLFNIYLSRKLDELKKYNDKEKLYIRLPIYYNDCDETCKEIYLIEGIEKDFFKLKEFKISLKDLVRKAFMKIRNIKIEEESDNSITISFSIERGMYATILLREIIRGDPRKFT